MGLERQRRTGNRLEPVGWTGRAAGNSGNGHRRGAEMVILVGEIVGHVVAAQLTGKQYGTEEHRHHGGYILRTFEP
jgi:hypothetical protein